MKTYSDLITIPDFYDRIRYLKTNTSIGDLTFGGSRSLNQDFYRSSDWLNFRKKIILRDSDGDSVFDLGHPDYRVVNQVYVHHINQITQFDILHRTKNLFDPENAICCSFRTHNLIHWGSKRDLPETYKERERYDTCPWKGK